MDQKRAVEIVKKYIALLQQKNFNLKHVYLFGSYANGQNNPDSDIDIALVFSDLKDRLAIQSKLLRLTKDFDYIIEPHPINKKDFNESNPFASEILKKGIKIL